MVKHKLLIKKSKEMKLELKLINIIRTFKLDPLYITSTKRLDFNELGSHIQVFLTKAAEWIKGEINESEMVQFLGS